MENMGLDLQRKIYQQKSGHVEMVERRTSHWSCLCRGIIRGPWRVWISESLNLYLMEQHCSSSQRNEISASRSSSRRQAGTVPRSSSDPTTPSCSRTRTAMYRGAGVPTTPSSSSRRQLRSQHVSILPPSASFSSRVHTHVQNYSSHDKGVFSKMEKRGPKYQ
jgi:hypothetical protein